MCGYLRFRAYEAAENGDLIIYPKGKDLVKYEGVASDIRLQLINTSDKTQSGAVRLVTSGGKLNSQTERITVKAGRTAGTAVTFDGNISSDDNKYFLEFIGDDGAVTKRETMSVFTKGLGESKNPSLAYTFRLLSGASDAAKNSDVKAAVPE